MGLSSEQMQMAQLIMSIAKQRGLSPQAGLIGVMTALTESGLQNLQGPPTDHDSGGLFQQRPSSGWGTYQQVRDPVYATNKFFDALSQVPNWQSMPPWQAAQAVQRSAYSDGSNYQGNYQQAYDLVSSNYSGVQPFNQSQGAYLTSSTSDSGVTGALTASQKEQALIQGAGALGGLLTTIPELKSLLGTAVSQGWTAAQFENAITNSQWYRTHSDNVRQQIALQASDPATYQANLNKEIVRIQQMGAELGIPMNHQAMAYLAMQSLNSGGWDQQTLQNAVGSLWGKSTGIANALAHPTGDAATLEQQIKQTYADYGVPINTATTQTWMQNILSGKNGSLGNQSIDTVKQAALTAAKSMYAPFAQQLDSGMTMRQIADPYVASMANLLELDPNSINFSTDPMVKKALQGTGATASGQPPTATPLWQFEQQVRDDPRWNYTVNAHNETSAMLTKLGQDWGMAS